MLAILPGNGEEGECLYSRIHASPSPPFPFLLFLSLSYVQSPSPIIPSSLPFPPFLSSLPHLRIPFFIGDREFMKRPENFSTLIADYVVTFGSF
jgi:hypothetical protein